MISLITTAESFPLLPHPSSPLFFLKPNTWYFTVACNLMWESEWKHQIVQDFKQRSGVWKQHSKNDGIEYFPWFDLFSCTCLSILSPCLTCSFLFQEALCTAGHVGHRSAQFSPHHNSVQALICGKGSLKCQDRLAGGWTKGFVPQQPSKRRVLAVVVFAGPDGLTKIFSSQIDYINGKSLSQGIQW